MAHIIASNDEVTIGRDARGEFIEFEGRKSWHGPLGSIEDAEEYLLREQQRAAEAAFRVRKMRAVLALRKAEAAKDAAAAREQRNARAAATRAHNADPFGFKAMEQRAAEREGVLS